MYSAKEIKQGLRTYQAVMDRAKPGTYASCRVADISSALRYLKDTDREAHLAAVLHGVFAQTFDNLAKYEEFRGSKSRAFRAYRRAVDTMVRVLNSEDGG